MSKVIFDISISVDGFMTADDITTEEPLGRDGQRLHAWATGGEVERVPSPVSSIGALIAGRRTFETSLPWWGAGGPHPPTPVFIIAHEPSLAVPPDSVYTVVAASKMRSREPGRQQVPVTSASWVVHR